MANNEQKAKKIVDSIFSTGFNTYKTFYEMAYNSAMKMAEWKEQCIIKKACEWLEKNISNYQNWEYNEFHQCVEYDGSVDIEKMINDFRKAMTK